VIDIKSDFFVVGKDCPECGVNEGSFHIAGCAKIAKYEGCKECNGLTYVIREFGEIACPECQPDAYAEQINNMWLGY
jgi:hypothetical protein